MTAAAEQLVLFVLDGQDFIDLGSNPLQFRYTKN